MNRSGPKLLQVANSTAVIAANDSMIANLLSDALSVMHLFASTLKIANADLKAIPAGQSNISLYVFAMDKHEDNLNLTRQLRAMEVSNPECNPCCVIWCTLQFDQEVKAAGRKFFVDHIIPRPFLTETVVEVILKALKLS